MGGTPKLCAWCEEEIVRPKKRLSKKEWATIKLHRHCVTAWRHHKCARKDIPQPPDRWCPACGTKLVRRAREQWQAWIKRQTCDRSCAAMGSVRVRKHPAELAKEEQLRVHVKQYIPGTPEFRQIAALYGG